MLAAELDDFPGVVVSFPIDRKLALRSRRMIRVEACRYVQAYGLVLVTQLAPPEVWVKSFCGKFFRVVARHGGEFFVIRQLFWFKEIAQSLS